MWLCCFCCCDHVMGIRKRDIKCYCSNEFAGEPLNKLLAQSNQEILSWKQAQIFAEFLCARLTMTLNCRLWLESMWLVLVLRSKQKKIKLEKCDRLRCVPIVSSARANIVQKKPINSLKSSWTLQCPLTTILSCSTNNKYEKFPFTFRFLRQELTAGMPCLWWDYWIEKCKMQITLKLSHKKSSMDILLFLSGSEISN